MDKRAKILADRIHSIYRTSKGCLDCNYVDFAVERDPRSGKVYTMPTSYGRAEVVALVAALREVGLDPEAVAREIQKSARLSHPPTWKGDSFGCCFQMETFLEIATKLLA